MCLENVTLRRTSGSLRLPNLNRNDGERTALRSIWCSNASGSAYSRFSK